MQLQVIQNKIFEIRGQKVMLDFDLAELYDVETKVFNQAVKRNIESFPAEFMFQLTKSEYKTLRSQIVTLYEQQAGGQELNSSQFVMMEKTGRGKYSKYLPYAFTEHGVTMLASVLKSSTAREDEYSHSQGFYCHEKDDYTIC
jgi:hypothetical protein